MRTILKTIIISLSLCLFTKVMSAQNNEALKILENGDVGIGTSLPSAKLDVNGNVNIKEELHVEKTAKLEGDLNVGGDANVSGTLHTNANVSANGNINASGKIQENNHDLLPKGAIIMWYGKQNEIPKGWLICDGANNMTPDLRDKFIVGAGGAYNVKAEGGKDKVALTIEEMPSHNHEVYKIEDMGNSYDRAKKGRHPTHWAGGYDTTFSTGGKYVKGKKVTVAHENRPPYFALYFIMKS